GEIFVRMAKQGSTISGLMDSFATAISLALQHGVPLKLLVDKFTHTRFEPSGWTGNPEISRASSLMDYIFRWLGNKFLPVRPPEQLTLLMDDDPRAPSAGPSEPSKDTYGSGASSTPSGERGAIEARSSINI